MPLPGGPSDKAGNRYEARWTVVCIAQVLRGDYESIRLSPNVTLAATLAMELQLPLERLVEDGWNKCVELGGGLVLEYLEAIDLGLQIVQIGDDPTLFFHRNSEHREGLQLPLIDRCEVGGLLRSVLKIVLAVRRANYG